ncbi:MAG: lysostaphin resistance A-like protein [Saprospiraceae bacterium]
MINNTTPNHPNYPPPVIILLTFITCLFGGLLGGGILFGIAAAQGMEITQLIGGLSEESTLGERNAVRFYTMINHLTTFVLPALFAAWFLFRKEMWQWLKMHVTPQSTKVIAGAALMVAAFPLVQLSLWLNQQLPLPEWMMTMENDTGDMIKGLLVMDSPVELLFNLLIIAVLPGLGEELVFRGLIQQSFRKWFGNPHVAIWVTAFIFSAIHFQFAGFLPRMILGALLGYLFYWTNNLWVPIVAHFVTNGLQVIGAFAAKDLLGDLEQAEVEPNWLAAAVSVVLVTLIVRYFTNKNNANYA